MVQTCGKARRGGNDVLDGGGGLRHGRVLWSGAAYGHQAQGEHSGSCSAGAAGSRAAPQPVGRGRHPEERGVAAGGGQAYRLELQGLAAGDAYQALAGYVVQADAQELVLVGLPGF